MNTNDCKLERVSNVTIGFLLLIFGGLFTLIGITVLPVLGLLIAIPTSFGGAVEPMSGRCG